MLQKRTAKEVVARAISQIGVTEVPFGSNRTPYGKAYGMDGNAWCAMFVWWVINYGAVQITTKTAYTPTLADWGRKMGILRAAGSAANPGDIVMFKMPGPDRINHTGIVIKRREAGQPLYCVEGNTGGSNPRAGGMVAATVRTKYIHNIIDMRTMYAPEPKPVPVPPKEKPVEMRRVVMIETTSPKHRAKLISMYRDEIKAAYAVLGRSMLFHDELADVKQVEAYVAQYPNEIKRTHAVLSPYGGHVPLTQPLPFGAFTDEEAFGKPEQSTVDQFEFRKKIDEIKAIIASME